MNGRISIDETAGARPRRRKTMMSLKQYFPRRVKEWMPPVIGLVLFLALVLPVSEVSAQTAFPNHAASNSSRRILEKDVTNNPSLNNGQPQIAVNPEHPKNLVFLSTADNEAATGLAVFQCFIAYSIDSGATWSPVVFPLGDAGGCGNPSLGVDSHGVFYIAFNLLGGTAPLAPGVVRSLDGGRTWSDPVVTPLQVGASPRLIVDSATDYVYVESSSAAPVGGLQAISVSKDHGLTWSPQAPLPDLTNQGLGNQIGVHDGILATAAALQIVGSQIVTTNPTFWVSFDNGQTWSAHPVTDSNGNPVPPPTGSLVPNVSTVVEQSTTDPIPWVSADPTHRGRFAVMVPMGDDLYVYITNDAGRTWTGPTVIAAPNVYKPWIEFGPTGLLGVAWRAASSLAAGGTPPVIPPPTATIDAYSAVSFNGGRSFSAPLRVNQTPEPAGLRIEGGDKHSSIVFGSRYVYVTWSDGRTGDWIDGIMSRVSLSLYHCGPAGQSNPVPHGCQPQF
jgi:BNR/Asp-box repeat